MIQRTKTVVLPANDPSALRRAAAVLRGGGLVSFPTDTVYGIGADIFQPAAVERVYQVKGRGTQKALPILLGDVKDLDTVAEGVSEAARKLAHRFWPGGLTLIVRRRALVPDIVTGGGPTVGVRVPNHPVPVTLIRLVRAPLVGTSANRSGEPSPVSAQQVRRSLGGLIEILLDGGPAPGGVESTVLDVTSDDPVLLREGALPAAELEQVLGHAIRRNA